MASIGEILGVEDCVAGMRPRVGTLKCISQHGELLEIFYSHLITNLRLIESSCIFLQNFVRNREIKRKEIITYARIRHYMAESMKIRKITQKDPFEYFNQVKNRDLISPREISTGLSNMIYPRSRSIGYDPRKKINISGTQTAKGSGVFRYTKIDQEHTLGRGPYTHLNSYFNESIKLKTVYKVKLNPKHSSIDEINSEYGDNRKLFSRTIRIRFPMNLDVL